MPLELDIEEPVLGGGVMPGTLGSGQGNHAYPEGIQTPRGAGQTPRVDYSDRLKHDNLLDQCLEIASLIRGKVMEDPEESELITVSNNRAGGSKFRTQSTVGLMLHGCVIEGMVVGGPAHHCRELERGDYIASIDEEAVDLDSVLAALIGSDQPGSTVTVTVQKGGAGGVSRRVVLQRMPSAVIAERLRFYDLFTEIKQRAEDQKDRGTEALIDDGISIWTKAILDQSERERVTAEVQSQMRDKCMRWLRDLDGNINELRAMQTMHLRRRDDADERMAEALRDLEVSRSMMDRLRQELVKSRVDLQDGLAREEQLVEELELARERGRGMQDRTETALERIRELDKDKQELSGQAVALHAELRRAYKTLEDDEQALREAGVVGEQRLMASEMAKEAMRADLVVMAAQLEDVKSRAKDAEGRAREADARERAVKEEVARLEAGLARAQRELEHSFSGLAEGALARETLEMEVTALRKTIAAKDVEVQLVRTEAEQERARKEASEEGLAASQRKERELKYRVGELQAALQQLKSDAVEESEERTRRVEELEEEARRNVMEAREAKALLQRALAELEAERAVVSGLSRRLSHSDMVTPRLQEDVKDAARRESQLREQLERLRAESDKTVEQWRQDRTEAGRRVDELTGMLSVLEKSNWSLSESNESLRSEVEARSHARDRAEAEKKEAEEDGKELAERVVKMREEAKAREEEADKWRRECEKLKERADSLADTKSVVEGEAEALREWVARLRTEAEAKGEEADKWKREREKLKERADSLAEELGSKQSAYAEVCRRTDDLAGRFSVLEKQNCSLSESNEALRSEVEARDKARERVEAAKRVAEGEAKALRERVARLREEVEVNAEEADRAGKECEKLKERVESLAGELGGEQGVLKRVLQDAVYAETEKRGLEREVAALKALLADEGGGRREAEEGRSLEEEARAKAEERCSRVAAESQRLRDEARRLNHALEDAQGKAAEWEGRAGGLARRAEELEREVAGLGGDLASSHQAAREEASRAAAKDAEAVIARAEVVGLKTQLAEALSRAGELESAVNEAVVAEGRARGRIGEVEAQLGGMRARGDGGAGESEKERDATVAALGWVYAACCPEQSVRGKSVPEMAGEASEAAHARGREVAALRLKTASLEKSLDAMEEVRGEARGFAERASMYEERVRRLEEEAVAFELRIREAAMALEVRAVELEGEKRLRVKAERGLVEREGGWAEERARMQAAIDKERASRDELVEAGLKEARAAMMRVRDSVCRERCIAGALGVTLRRGLVAGDAGPDRYVVQTIAPGGPGEACGRMEPGDEVVSVGGVALSGKSAKEVMSMCAGGAGSQVQVMGRKRGGEGYTVVLERQRRASEGLREAAAEACDASQRLHDEVVALRVQCGRLSGSKERVRMAESAAEDNRARWREAKARCGEAEAELSRSREQLDAALGEARNLRRLHREGSEQAALEGQRARKAERELGQAQAMASLARRDADALQDKVVMLEGALIAERAGWAEERAKAGVLEGKVEGCEGEKKALEGSVEMLKEEVASLKGGLPRLEETVRGLQGELDERAAWLKVQVAAQDKEVRMTCERIKGAPAGEREGRSAQEAAELAGLRGRLEGEQRRGKEREKAVEMLRGEAAGLKTREAQLERLLAEANKELDALGEREREERRMLTAARGQVSGAMEAAGMLEGMMRQVHAAIIRGARAAGAAMGEVGITLTSSNGRVVIKEVVAGGAAEACGKMFGGDTLVTVASRDARGLSVRDVQRLFAGEPGMPVHVEGYRPGTGLYSVTLVRGGGGVSALDMCDEVCRAAGRLHEEMGLLRGNWAAGREREGGLEAKIAGVEASAKEAEQRCGVSEAGRVRGEADLKEALERVEALSRDAVKTAESIVAERKRVRDAEEEVARTKAEVSQLAGDLAQVKRDAEASKRAAAEAQNAGVADRAAKDEAVIGQRESEGKVGLLHKTIKELEREVEEGKEGMRKAREQCGRLEAHARSLKAELEATVEDKKGLYKQVGESDKRAKELQVGLERSEKSLREADEKREREVAKEAERWEVLVCDLERRTAGIEADMKIAEDRRKIAAERRDTADAARAIAEDMERKSLALLRRSEDEMEQLKRVGSSVQLELSDARRGIHERDVAIAEERKAFQTREDATLKEVKALTEKLKVTSAEADRMRTRIAALEREVETLKGRVEKDKEREKALGEQLAKCKAELEAAMKEVITLSKVGVGMLVSEKPPHRVSRIVEGGGAHLSKLVQVGDDILEVDGLDCGKMSIVELKARLQGRQNSEVKVKFSRRGAKGEQVSETEVAMMRGVPGQGSDFLHRPASKNWFNTLIGGGLVAAACGKAALTIPEAKKGANFLKLSQVSSPQASQADSPRNSKGIQSSPRDGLPGPSPRGSETKFVA